MGWNWDSIFHEGQIFLKGLVFFAFFVDGFSLFDFDTKSKVIQMKNYLIDLDK